MKSKINLVVLTPGFTADEHDSTAIPSLQLFLGNLRLLHPEISIRIVTFHYPFLQDRYLWKGISVYAAGGAGKRISKIPLWIRILVELFRLRKAGGIDIIHTFWYSETALIGLLFGRLTGTPVVATAMGQEFAGRNTYFFFLRMFHPQLTAISEYQAGIMRKVLRTGSLRVIPFGVDSAFYGGAAPERTLDIVGVGSLNETKNYPLFIETVGSLVKTFPDLRCAIIGEGKERTRIETLIARYGLRDRIRLLGEVSYGEVIRTLRRSRILLHTSLYEGQGLVISEALAAGAYVVSCPVGTAWNGHFKKLRTGNGQQELERHLAEILHDKNPDHSPEIFFTMEATCREYSDLYHTQISSS
jgi:glycosyltransferase involved in cell wall biosynthesis